VAVIKWQSEVATTSPKTPVKQRSKLGSARINPDSKRGRKGGEKGSMFISTHPIDKHNKMLYLTTTYKYGTK
jgi:hypothetical protein